MWNQNEMQNGQKVEQKKQMLKEKGRKLESNISNTHTLKYTWSSNQTKIQIHVHAHMHTLYVH